MPFGDRHIYYFKWIVSMLPSYDDIIGLLINLTNPM